MAFLPQKNVSHVFVSKDPTNIIDTSGTITGYADIEDGVIGFVDEDNALVSDITNADKFRVVCRSGTSLLYSPWITRSSIVRAKTTSYSAPVQQLTYIGYNGSTGEIVETNNNNYIINILLKSTTGQFGNKQMFKHAIYVSDPLATEQEVAEGLIANLDDNFSREPVDYIDFDLVSNVALASDYGFDDAHVSVIHGSPTITATTGTFIYNTGTAVVAGDYIRISDAAAVGTAVALDDPVYKVLTVNSTTSITLNRPVTTVTGTFTHTAGDITVITAASAQAGHFGIKMHGLAQTNFQLGAITQYLVDFEVGLVNFDETTTVTYTTAASRGKGTYYDVAEMEWFSQGNWGKQLKLGIPPPTMIQSATSSGIYDLISFQYSHTMDGGVIGYPATSYGEIIIALRCDGPTHTKANAVLDVLQADTTHFPAAMCANFS